MSQTDALNAVEVERLEVVEVRAGDVVVIHMPERPSPTMEEVDRVGHAAQELWPKNRVFVISSGMRIEVTREVTS